MVSPTLFAMMHIALIISISISLLIHQSIGSNIICEELPQDKCAFSVSATSKRCVLESYRNSGKTEYQCRTSDVGVDRISNHIESDQCVKACGIDRNNVGISSDALFEPLFVQKLCSAKCFQMCPNVIDLYYDLAAGEGVYLPDLCHASRSNPNRAMVELMSSGSAPGPSSSDDLHITRTTASFSPIPSPNSAPAPASEYSYDVSDSSPNNAPGPAPQYSDQTSAPAPAPEYSDSDSSPSNAPAPASEYYDEEFDLSPNMAPASAPEYSDKVSGYPDGAPAHAPAYSDEVSDSPGSAPAHAPNMAPASAPEYSDKASGSPDGAPAHALAYSDEVSDSPGSAPSPGAGYPSKIFDSLCQDCL